MDKIPMNLEQTVQYLLDEVNKLKAGIAPGELIPGPQGVQGPEGQKPEVSISNATGNWVIDGVDTGKPSRGKQGEKGNTGMQGVPGVGVSTMLSIDSTEYTPTVTDDGEYQDVESSADIKYSDGGEEHSTQVDFNIKVPKPDLSGKLDKVTTSFGVHDNRVYAITSSGAQTMLNAIYYSADTTPLSQTGVIPLYYAGRINVSNPITSNNAVNKAYVDNNFQGKVYVHSGYIVGPGYNYYNYRVLSSVPTAFTTVGQLSGKSFFVNGYYDEDTVVGVNTGYESPYVMSTLRGSNIDIDNSTELYDQVSQIN